MKKKSAILFSTYIPNIEAGLIVGEYLQAIERNFTGWDTDLYTGINYCYGDDIQKTLDLYFGRFSYGSDYDMVAKDLVVPSDASAYQKALELYKEGSRKLVEETGEDYEYVWFIHSKSVTSRCHEFRREVFRDFIDRRENIERFMGENKLDMFYPWVSRCGNPMELNTNLNKIIKNRTNDVYISRYWGLTSQYTFYVFSGMVLKKILQNLLTDFFEKNIITDYGMNKYFFENDFCMIPFKLGFERFGYDKQEDRIKFLENYMIEKTYMRI